MNRSASAGVRETRAIHDVHRSATSLLADLGAEPVRAPAAIAFRDFVIAMLEHHHTSEDEDLWPLVTTRAPQLADEMDELSAEHDRLQRLLDRLQTLPLGNGHGGAGARALTAAVRDSVHGHLAHEEPVLLPALDDDLSAEDWDEFSRRTVASAPQDGLPFMLALIDEVASPADAELVFRHVPPEARATIPARRAEGAQALAELRSRRSGQVG